MSTTLSPSSLTTTKNLLGICHAARRLVLLFNGGAALLVGRHLLVLLDEIADAAAAGRGDVGEAAALEVVLGADLGALHRHRDPVETDAPGTAEEKALYLVPCLCVVFLYREKKQDVRSC
jgi:hypothetical protein